MPQSSKTQTTAKPGSSKRGKGENREALILLMIGIPVVIVGILLATLYDSGQSTAVSVDDTRLIRSDSPTLGSATAPVTIVEFLDPECESCRAAFPFVKQLLEEYDERVRLVVRYFPLHNNSVLAATVTEAAGAQGMYWEMQEMLFARQPEWGEQRTPQIDLFMSYATELGLNIEQFTADLQNPDYLARIERDQADGEALGVTGTPTFFINGRLVEELSADAIIAMIEEELAR
ncbi:MAG: DsbA family protein [Chloroflexi bacterium]|nr:DsbA family protein [Chloroflexota bacterium]